MRILLVDGGTTWRGGQRQSALLAACLASRGIAVAIASPMIRVNGVTTTPWTARSDLSFFAAYRLARIARQQRADLVHAMDARSHAIARLATLFGLRAPLVVTRHLARTPRAGRKYRGVARFIAVSPAVRAALARVADPSSISVIPPALRIPAHEPKADLAALGIAADDTVILTVAALTAEKGVDRVLRAAAAAVSAGLKACWLVVGDGPERPVLERLARALGAPVRFAGWREDVGSMLRAAHLLVHLPRAESFGLAVAEAMARGVPVVAARVGGLVDLVTPDVGTLVNADDPEHIVPAIRHWLTDSAARDRARRAAPAIVASYGADRMTDATLAAYQDALHAAADRPVRLPVYPFIRLSS